MLLLEPQRVLIFTSYALGKFDDSLNWNTPCIVRSKELSKCACYEFSEQVYEVCKLYTNFVPWSSYINASWLLLVLLGEMQAFILCKGTTHSSHQPTATAHSYHLIGKKTKKTQQLKLCELFSHKTYIWLGDTEQAELYTITNMEPMDSKSDYVHTHTQKKKTK